MTEYKLRTHNVRKTYGSVVALKAASIEMQEGEFLTLLGPSGSGKTTLLMAIAGLNNPDSGDIWIDGKLANFLPPFKRDLGMVFQNYALFPHMNIFDNIAFPLRMRKMPMALIRKEVARVLEIVELDHVAKRFPRELSGGQQQRIALARCFVYKPSIILMDEPLGALDKKLRETLQREIKQLHENLGITVLYVTHDQEEAMTVSSRIGVMDSGKLTQVATPTQIYEAPINREVADFIGDVNLFKGIYKGQDEKGTQLLSDDSKSIIYATQKVEVPVGNRIWFALRPEKLEITKKLPEVDCNILKGKIEDIGYGGSFSTYHVKLENGRQLTAIRANRERTAEQHLSWGDEVYLHWAPHSAIVLLS